MNKQKLILAAGVTAAGALVIGTASLVSVFAATQSNAGNTAFVQKLAQKLGIEQSKVDAAVTQTRSEMQAEMQAQAKVKIKEAVTAGKLTQRQADILSAEMDFRESLTVEQRQANRDELRSQHETEIIAALKGKGLTVTATELQDARKAAQTAGIMGVGMGRPGMGGNRAQNRLE